MYVVSEKSAAALAKKLPTLEVLLRLQSEMEKIAHYLETNEEPTWFGGELSGNAIDEIIDEVSILLKSPLGFELFLYMLPSLVELSKKGARVLNSKTDIS